MAIESNPLRDKSKNPDKYHRHEFTNLLDGAVFCEFKITSGCKFPVIEETYSRYITAD
jgi:hypothetical protein